MKKLYGFLVGLFLISLLILWRFAVWEYDPNNISQLAAQFNSIETNLDLVEQIDDVVFQKKLALEKISNQLGGDNNQVNYWIRLNNMVIEEHNPIQKSILFEQNHKSIPDYRELYKYFTTIILLLMLCVMVFGSCLVFGWLSIWAS